MTDLSRFREVLRFLTVNGLDRTLAIQPSPELIALAAEYDAEIEAAKEALPDEPETEEMEKAREAAEAKEDEKTLLWSAR